MTQLQIEQNIIVQLSWIQSVQRQIVTGSSYTIKAQLLLPQRQSSLCDLNFFEQEWRQFNKLIITCGVQIYTVQSGLGENVHVRLGE